MQWFSPNVEKILKFNHKKIKLKVWQFVLFASFSPQSKGVSREIEYLKNYYHGYSNIFVRKCFPGVNLKIFT